MNSDDTCKNAECIPPTFNMKIHSKNETKHYVITPEQSSRYEKLMDHVRSSYIISFILSFLGISSSVICIILLFFQSTRKYAFYSLITIVTGWFSYTYYLTYKGNLVANEIDNLLDPLEVSK
jgi:hypothetical protein